MAQLNNATLELHQRVLADLDRRDLAVGDKEGEARRLFEQVLAQCSAERTAIAGERNVLMQAEELYVRFLSAHETIRPDEPEEDLPLPDTEALSPVVLASELASEPDVSPQVELPAEEKEPEMSDLTSEIEAKMRELRDGLAEEVARENAAEQKPAKWPSPLRALLGPVS